MKLPKDQATTTQRRLFHRARRACISGFRGTLIYLVLLIATSLVSAVADTSRPNPDSGPTPVEVGIFLVSLDAIDTAAQTFEANVYFEATWKDQRLIQETGGLTITRPLEQIWHPRLQILNQQRIWSSLPEVVEIDQDGTVTMRARVWGSFSQPLKLGDFPFDTQQLVLPVVAAGYSPEEVALLPSHWSGIGEFSIPNWRTKGWHLISDYKVTTPDGYETAAIAMALQIKRLPGYYIVKIIIPLFLIVTMSLAVFWIDPEDTNTKIILTATAMLTLIAYRFTMGISLPQISYLTRLDLLILSSTIIVYASLVVVVTTAALSRKGKDGVARRIDRVSRWGFPLVFITSWLVSIF